MAAGALSAAGVNGVLSGWRRVYAWRTPEGVLAFVVDSTWASLSTLIAMAGLPLTLTAWSLLRAG